MKQRMRRLIGLMLAVVMILNLIPGGSVAVAADTIYTLTGLTASSTGVGQTGGMYGPTWSVSPEFSDGSSLDPSYYAIGHGVFCTDKDCKNVITYEPRVGETYYSKIIIEVHGTITFDISQLDLEDVSLTIPGYTVTVEDISWILDPSYPYLDIKYSAKRVGSATANTLTGITVTADGLASPILMGFEYNFKWSDGDDYKPILNSFSGVDLWIQGWRSNTPLIGDPTVGGTYWTSYDFQITRPHNHDLSKIKSKDCELKIPGSETECLDVKVEYDKESDSDIVTCVFGITYGGNKLFTQQPQLSMNNNGNLYNVNWETSFVPVVLYRFKNGEFDKLFSDSTVTSDTVSDGGVYKYRAYYGTWSYEYIESDEFTIIGSHTVTFRPNYGDSTPPKASTQVDGKLQSLPTITRSGYTFMGWYTALDGGNKVDPDTVYTSDTILYARWEKDPTVTFDTHNGSAVASQTVKNGGYATRPATDPKKGGWTFVDWYADEACTTLFDFSKPITADTTIHAKWETYLIPFTVTFNVDGGTSVASQKVLEGEKVVKPADPTKAGYSFVGWYKNSRKTISFDFDNTEIYENTTIYARWRENPYIIERIDATGSGVAAGPNRRQCITGYEETITWKDDNEPSYVSSAGANNHFFYTDSNCTEPLVNKEPSYGKTYYVCLAFWNMKSDDHTIDFSQISSDSTLYIPGYTASFLKLKTFVDENTNRDMVHVIFKVRKGGYHFTTQPKGGMIDSNGQYTVTWATDFTPVKLERYNFVENMDKSYDDPRITSETFTDEGMYFYRAYYGTGKNDYVRSHTFTIVNEKDYMTGITIDSSGVAATSDGHYEMEEIDREITWDIGSGYTRFKCIISGILFTDMKCSSYLKEEPEEGGTYYVKCSVINATPDDHNTDFSYLIKENCELNLPGYKAMCISVETTSAYIDYEDAMNDMVDIIFAVRKGGYHFTTQPKSGILDSNGKYTVTWATDFTPVKLERYRYSYKDASEETEIKSYDDPAITSDTISRDGYYYYRAYYGTGEDEYVASNDFSVVDELISMTGITINSNGVAGTSYGHYEMKNMKREITWDPVAENIIWGYYTDECYLYTDMMCSDKLKKEPGEGDTYYVKCSVINMISDDHNMDFSSLTKENCELNISGYASRCISVETTTEHYYDEVYDMVLIIFEVKKEAPHTITFADVNAKTISASNAVITGVTDGQKASGELSFTVECDKACIVLVSDDNGETYTRIEAVKTAAENTGSFTIDVQSDILLVVARLGDVSLDGKVDSADALQILRFDVNKAKFDAAQKLIADVSYDGKIDSADALQILRFDVNKAKLKWNKDDTI